RPVRRHQGLRLRAARAGPSGARVLHRGRDRLPGHMSEERFLVTGALGVIGAWTVATLVRASVPVVAFDLGDDTRRLRLILSEEELAQVALVRGDTTDRASIEQDRKSTRLNSSHLVISY